MRLLILPVFLLVTACASQPSNYYDEEYDDDSSEPKERHLHRKELLERTMKDRALLDAYERGARDTLEDQKGRLRAQRGFVYEPPVIEYMDIPAGISNGAAYPGHKVPVILKKGRWTERNNVMLPNINK